VLVTTPQKRKRKRKEKVVLEMVQSTIRGNKEDHEMSWVVSLGETRESIGPIDGPLPFVLSNSSA
jgi:hypothetical protein